MESVAAFESLFGTALGSESAPGVTQGLKPYTIQGSSPNTWTLAPQGTPLWQTTWFNFAPRLGVAYILRNTPGRETVVRGGGGVFFDTGQQVGSLASMGPGFPRPVNSCPDRFQDAPAFPAIVNPPVPPYSILCTAFAPSQLPYTLQWNASYRAGTGQIAGPHRFLCRLARSAIAAGTIHHTDRQPNNRPNVDFTSYENGLTSDYDSLQVQFRRRLSRG